MPSLNYKITFLIILFISSSLFIPTQAIDENDFFLYEITDGGHYLKAGEFVTTNEGFGSLNYPAGTTVNATIDYFSVGGILFKYWVGEQYSVKFIDLDWLDSHGERYSFMALYLAYEMIADYHNGYLANLILYTIFPYLDPVYTTYLNSPENLVQAIKGHFNNHWYPDVECLADYSSIDNVLYFENWVGGKVDGYFGESINEKTNYPSKISFGNSIHLVVNKISGTVYGFGLRGWVEGTINDISVKVSCSYEYELLGYDLPDYSFGSYKNFLKNDKTLTIVLSSVIPSVVVVALLVTFSIIFRCKRLQKS
ncbi:MAG: choice-of-anchor S family protein [Candidatus Thorarchaeota archaeon]